MRDNVKQMARETLSTVVLLAGSAFATDQDREARNFVKNPGFEIVDEHQSLPIGWRPVTPRAENSPTFELDDSVAHSGEYPARVSSQGSPGTFGHWATKIPGIEGENLEARTFERWLSVGGYGEWKNLYPRERRPETYGPLVK